MLYPKSLIYPLGLLSSLLFFLYSLPYNPSEKKVYEQNMSFVIIKTPYDAYYDGFRGTGFFDEYINELQDSIPYILNIETRLDPKFYASDKENFPNPKIFMDGDVIILADSIYHNRLISKLQNMNIEPIKSSIEFYKFKDFDAQSKADNFWISLIVLIIIGFVNYRWFALGK